MKSKNYMNRRDFIGTTAATAAAITVVPRHVLGGPGYVAPSDKITVANIGCGTQGLREMPGMLQNPDLQVVAVADVNRLDCFVLLRFLQRAHGGDVVDRLGLWDVALKFERDDLDALGVARGRVSVDGRDEHEEP